MKDESTGLERVNHILWEFTGREAWHKAQNALEHIEWLRRELSISRYNEKAALAVIEQDRHELFALRSKMRFAKACMESNDPLNARTIFGKPKGDGDEKETRQASGAASAQQERKDH